MGALKREKNKVKPSGSAISVTFFLERQISSSLSPELIELSRANFVTFNH